MTRTPSSLSKRFHGRTFHCDCCVCTRSRWFARSLASCQAHADPVHKRVEFENAACIVIASSLPTLMTLAHRHHLNKRRAHACHCIARTSSVAITTTRAHCKSRAGLASSSCRGTLPTLRCATRTTTFRPTSPWRIVAARVRTCEQATPSHRFGTCTSHVCVQSTSGRVACASAHLHRRPCADARCSWRTCAARHRHRRRPRTRT